MKFSQMVATLDVDSVVKTSISLYDFQLHMCVYNDDKVDFSVIPTQFEI